MDLTDTHCHLDFELFDDDRAEVIDRALEAGLVRMLNPGIDLQSSRKAVLLAETYSHIFAAVGVHPNEGLGWDAKALDELEALAVHPKVVAIGEIGLDYYREQAPHDLQIKIFRDQLDLAARSGKPVIIHNRNATTDTLKIISAWYQELRAAESPLADCPGVLHSFGGDRTTALSAFESNFLIGINGPITFKNAPDLRETVAGLELGHLLIETDAPFLTPHPYRGKRNEPAMVSFIASKLAEIFSQPDTSVASATTDNAIRIFHW
jgi:TatD DNase family protein